jgi:hypothetical protein
MRTLGIDSMQMIVLTVDRSWPTVATPSITSTSMDGSVLNSCSAAEIRSRRAFVSVERGDFVSRARRISLTVGAHDPHLVTN